MTQLVGLGVLLLTIAVIIVALELANRRPHPPATAARHDADTRRLLTELRHARDRQPCRRSARA